MERRLTVMCLLLAVLLASGCAEMSVSCPAQPFADLSQVDDLGGDDFLPFQFPLDSTSTTGDPSPARFCESGGRDRLYHAAEDYHHPAGTPVYSIADGEVSFSGRMGGYGWLVIVDHPQANLYSLYGHLSPSRWQIEPGPVEKGELLGYLGDDDENGGSADEPLVTHLHLGVRTGQRSDYPGMGQWRWMAGWIKPCPADAGWLRPSAVITAQEIPQGGFIGPSDWFLTAWWIELLFGAAYLVAGVGVLIYSTRPGKRHLLFLSGTVMAVAGLLFSVESPQLSLAVLAMAAVLLATGTSRVVTEGAAMKRLSGRFRRLRVE